MYLLFQYKFLVLLVYFEIVVHGEMPWMMDCPCQGWSFQDCERNGLGLEDSYVSCSAPPSLEARLVVLTHLMVFTLFCASIVLHRIPLASFHWFALHPVEPPSTCPN